MTVVAYCTQAELEIALGGAAVLVQLADPNMTGTADATTVQDYLESGAARVRSVVEVRYAPEVIAALDSDSLRLLRDLNKWFSAQIAWLEGSRGADVPDRVQAQAEWADKTLAEIRTGERRLGRVSGGTVPALSTVVASVDHDPLGTGVSVAGFKRGFR